MIGSVLTLLSAPDVQPWLHEAVTALRLATATINFAVAVHRGVHHLRKKAK
ncbi:hypothetical protein ABH920_004175 [Catenulispora sp. EB89]|uniref:hypothetical protein n=1 Tax=Catenulispora sp. EB89 TaxID=3156257 RepID=UPI003517D71E